MSAKQGEWKVLPHGPLTQVGPRVMTAVGEIHMPLVELPRRMTVVKTNAGGLIVFSCVNLDEASMQKLEAFGTPAYLLVPNERHRMDVQAWKARYPSMVVIAPPGARKEVEEKVPVDATWHDFGDSSLRLVVVPGTGEKELALEVRDGRESILVINEIIWNIDHQPGLGGLVERAIGMTGESPKIPTFTKLASVKDKPALGAQLQEWSQLENLTRILVSHGDIIQTDPSGTLSRLATELGA